MKNKIFFILTVLIVMLFMSCASVGQHLPISSNEEVIGTVHAVFAARDSWLAKKDYINTQSYIKLLEAAVVKFPGDIDVRDIVWVTGRVITPGNTEISAMAKVIRINSNEN